MNRTKFELHEIGGGVCCGMTKDLDPKEWGWAIHKLGQGSAFGVFVALIPRSAGKEFADTLLAKLNKQGGW